MTPFYKIRLCNTGYSKSLYLIGWAPIGSPKWTSEGGKQYDSIKAAYPDAQKCADESASAVEIVKVEEIVTPVASVVLTA